MTIFFSLTKYDLRMCTVTQACIDLGNTGVNGPPSSPPHF